MPYRDPMRVFGSIGVRRTGWSAPVVFAAALTLSACNGNGASHAAKPAGSPASARPARSTATSPSPSPSPSTETASPTPATAAGGPVPAGFSAVSVTFVSDTHGWALGAPHCASSPCTSIVRTTDRGQHWVGIPAPRAADPLTIRFADDRDGWVLVGTPGPQASDLHSHRLFATHDGGASWTPVGIPGGYPVSVATNGTDVFVVVVPDNGHNHLLAAPVAGGGWRDLGAVAGQALTVHGSHVWVYTSEAMQVAHSWTVDYWDGQSLASFALPCTQSIQAALAASGPVNLALVCAGQPAAGQMRKSVFTSADGGDHWTHVSGPPLAGYAYHVAATTRGTFLTGSRSPIYVTRDAGKTWQRMLWPPIDGGGGFSYVGFTDAAHGVAVPTSPSDHRLFFSDNAGASWQPRGFG